MVEAMPTVSFFEAINQPVCLVNSLDFADSLVVVVDDPKSVLRALHSLF